MDKIIKPRGAGNSRFEAADSTDFFPTPLWATRALIERVMKPLGLYNSEHDVWEPACGQGHMLLGLQDYYPNIKYSDIANPGKAFIYGDTSHKSWESGHEFEGRSFFDPYFDAAQSDWIITNPPFNLFQQFFDRAMALGKVGVAFFVPLTALEGKMRYEKIFKRYAGKFCVAPFVERVPIVKNEVRKDATTARAYAWLIVIHNISLPPLHHIPPCRKQLERDEDYDV